MSVGLAYSELAGMTVSEQRSVPEQLAYRFGYAVSLHRGAERIAHRPSREGRRVNRHRGAAMSKVRFQRANRNAFAHQEFFSGRDAGRSPSETFVLAIVKFRSPK